MSDAALSDTGMTNTGSRLYAASDLYDYESLLNQPELDVLGRLRKVLHDDVKPLLTEAWENAQFPTAIKDRLTEADLMAPPELDGTKPRSLFEGFRNFELARTDASVATYYNGQSGLFRTTVAQGGSEEQVAKWDPLITTCRMNGVFALTEPEHGSDIAGGLATSARRDGDTWILNGEKRWIGSAGFADYLAVMARDEADGKVKGFLVATDSAGVRMDKIGNKISMRIVQNAHIGLTDVEVDESMRLAKINSFADVARLLRSMRSDVAWIATGVAAGAYEAALKYVTERQQFGRPVASFQLVQEKLVTMLGNVTASLGMAVRLAQQQDRGVYRDEDSALAKSWCAARARETAALAREVAGGNGITLDADVGRFFADAEAIYSYEGTHEINSLVVGRAITGHSAFVR
ncbi:acyl-CoA dehydrogenase family protein [Arthrobacter castelli]|uniref:acyl-CoA dehydrogenase family protein n=1 Tax=Arthrobacter castelli TaxID=271431 RepID=UPI0004236085|nr:acyl-CoA dehydrogenase family protein [Arthrobacter castelli]